MAANIDEKLGLRRDDSELGQRESGDRAALFVNERRGLSQAKSATNLAEIFAIAAVLEVNDLAAAIDARLAGNLLNEINAKTQPAQAKDPLQARPSVSAVPRLIGQSAADNRDPHDGLLPLVAAGAKARRRRSLANRLRVARRCPFSATSGSSVFVERS